MNRVAEILKRAKLEGLKIEISGHTDNIGEAAYNLGLSDYRARSVADYLISKDNRRVWENLITDITKSPGTHPSEFGHNLIANEIFEFINQNKNDIIRYNNNKKIKIL